MKWQHGRSTPFFSNSHHVFLPNPGLTLTMVINYYIIINHYCILTILNHYYSPLLTIGKHFGDYQITMMRICESTSQGVKQGSIGWERMSHFFHGSKKSWARAILLVKKTPDWNNMEQWYTCRVATGWCPPSDVSWFITPINYKLVGGDWNMAFMSFHNIWE